MQDEEHPENNSGNRSGVSRRNCLKKVGTAAGAIALGSNIAVARSPGHHNSEELLHKVVKQARKIREKTGSHERYVQHIKNSPLEMEHQWGTWKVPQVSQSPDDVTTQELPQSAFSHSLTLSYTCESNEMVMDYRWNHDYVCPPNNYDGKEPRDIAGLHWQTDDYTYLKDTKFTGEYVYLDEDDGDIETHGLVAEYDDKNHAHDASNGSTDCGVSMSSYFGGTVYIENSDPPYSRTVNMDYYHYYNSTSCSITGVSIGSDGVISVSMDCSNNVENWHIQGYEDEEIANDTCCENCT